MKRRAYLMTPPHGMVRGGKDLAGLRASHNTQMREGIRSGLANLNPQVPSFSNKKGEIFSHISPQSPNDQNSTLRSTNTHEFTNDD